MESRKLSHSQNFLKGHGFVADLIGMTNLGSGDLVVEIGSGKGIITEELSKKVGKVIGIEYDSTLASNLKLKFSSYPNVEIIQADFLNWSLPTQPYKVFANIPFNMISDIVNKLFTSTSSPDVTYLIMQDKAAERFIGKPLGPDSQVSILLKPFYDMSIVTKIDRRNFEPMPNVNVVLAKFEKKKNPKINLNERQLYRDFVIYGYNQWQPTVTDSFRKVFTDKQLAILSKGLKIAGSKPSQLSIDQWVGLFDSFMKYVPEERKGIIKGSENRLRLKQSNMQKQHRTRKND